MLDYNSIYNTYSPRLKVMFKKQVKDKDYIDDLVQETMLKVWSKLDTYDDKYQLSTWIYTIAFNTLKNYFKALKDHVVYKPEIYDSDATEDLASPEAILIADEQTKQFNKTIEELDDNFLSVYVLKEVDELTYQQIADQLSIPIGTVKSRVKRAKDHIKNQLI